MKPLKHSIEDIRELAALERDMDSGKRPYVMFGGGRLAVNSEIMQELGLELGQTVSWDIFRAIAKLNIAHCHAKIALIKAAKPEG